MTKYLTIGTNQILADLHQPIRNGQIKPTGGLWATIHDPNYLNYNPWIEILSLHPHILFYKIRNLNTFEKINLSKPLKNGYFFVKF